MTTIDRSEKYGDNKPHMGKEHGPHVAKNKVNFFSISTERIGAQFVVHEGACTRSHVLSWWGV